MWRVLFKQHTRGHPLQRAAVSYAGVLLRLGRVLLLVSWMGVFLTAHAVSSAMSSVFDVTDVVTLPTYHKSHCLLFSIDTYFAEAKLTQTHTATEGRYRQRQTAFMAWSPSYNDVALESYQSWGAKPIDTAMSVAEYLCKLLLFRSLLFLIFVICVNLSTTTLL
jgi:hypothetical protein